METAKCYGLISSPSPPFTAGLPEVLKGLWIGQFVPVVPIAYVLLCLLQVLQYRSWCQELEKQLEATGVSEAVLCSP